jgi:hypothetical protein
MAEEQKQSTPLEEIENHLRHLFLEKKNYLRTYMNTYRAIKSLK